MRLEIKRGVARTPLRNLLVILCLGMAGFATMRATTSASHSLLAPQARPENHGTPTAPISASTVTLTGTSGQKVSISAPEIATLPRTTLTVFDAHTNSQKTFTGVLLTELLSRIDAPLGEKLRGKAMSIRVIAEGSDHYTALYSLAEIDPAFHPGSIIIADTMNGQPLPVTQGPLQLINTEDKRPARWVRQLVAIRLIAGD